MAYNQNRGTVFTLQRDGTQNKAANIYTSWTDLIADIAGIEGHKTIVFDLSSFSGAVIPAGAYDLENITLSGGPANDAGLAGFPLDPDPATIGKTSLVLTNGVTFTNLHHITNGLRVKSISDDSIITLSGSSDNRLVIDNGSSLEATTGQQPPGGGGGPGFISIEDTATLRIYLHNGGLLRGIGGGDGVGLVVDVQGAGGSLLIFASGQSLIEEDILTDSGLGGTVNVTDLDGAPTIFTDQSGSTGDPGLGGGLLTVINNVDADSIAYDPSTSGLTGENVQDAIDDLAFQADLLGITTVGSTATLGVDDGPLIDVAIGAGSIRITLPAVATTAAGKTYHIKDADGVASGSNIELRGNLSEEIDGFNTFLLTTNFQSVTIVNLGDKWTLI